VASGARFGEASKVSRFRVVIYLCGARNADLGVPRTQCREYAGAFGWDVVAEIEETEGLNNPAERDGLARAIEHVKEERAGAVLTPWRTMISPIAREYDETARSIEKWGGFLQVMEPPALRLVQGPNNGPQGQAEASWRAKPFGPAGSYDLA
jgi:hypothetical protein